MPYALDYSAGRPAAGQVLAAGYAGVIRYIGFPTNRKCITAAEYADMTGAGVGVSLVYEQTAGDALLGREAGRTAGRRALAHATDIGYPTATRPIYYACDTDVVTDAQFAAVLDYLRGAADIHGSPALVGVYGEYDVVERAAQAGVCAWYWQTRAWSGGRLNGRAHLRQEIGTYTVGGVACDRNTILASDWGQTGMGEASMSQAEVDAINAHTDQARQALADQLSGMYRLLTVGDGPAVAEGSDTHPHNFKNVRARVTSLSGALAALAAQPAADVDEAALAAALAPLLIGAVGHVTDDDLARISTAVNDEFARRQAS